jgi:uncharacterized membrane protein YsdA (DUF1294 family)
MILQSIHWIIIGYIVIVNIYGFAIMGIDKKRAIRGAWRIPERSLFLTAIIGGSIGTIIGMHHFRHKTKHWYFKYGMPAILLIQVIVVIVLLVNNY